MKTKLSKSETEQKIKDFFEDIKNKTPKEIKKIKKLAMSKNIKLGDLKKKFCKACYSNDLMVKKITKNMKTIECNDCKKISRYRLK